MTDIWIKLEIPDENAPAFDDKDMIVTPATDFEAGQLACALVGIADTQELTLRALRTLVDVLETKGVSSADIMKTVKILLEPNRLAGEQIDFIRLILGRSARVGKKGNERGPIQ